MPPNTATTKPQLPFLLHKTPPLRIIPTPHTPHHVFRTISHHCFEERLFSSLHPGKSGISNLRSVTRRETRNSCQTQIGLRTYATSKNDQPVAKFLGTKNSNVSTPPRTPRHASTTNINTMANCRETTPSHSSRVTVSDPRFLAPSRRFSLLLRYSTSKSRTHPTGKPQLTSLST